MLAQVREGLSPAGEDFMGIRLMPDVLDDLVLRGVENVVHGNGELYGTQARG